MTVPQHGWQASANQQSNSEWTKSVRRIFRSRQWLQQVEYQGSPAEATSAALVTQERFEVRLWVHRSLRST
jgi:hypothetical protein